MALGISQINIELARFKQEEAQVQREAAKSAGGPQVRSQGTASSKPEPREASQKETILEAKKERLIQQLRQVDREVRAHEQAHLMAAGSYARGAPHYEYIRGPDGRLYAVAGEVKIDTSPVPGDPEATLEKARAIKRAALAPANPSSQDRLVAALADRMAARAMMELQKEHLESIKASVQTEVQSKQKVVSRYQEVANNALLPPALSLNRKA